MARETGEEINRAIVEGDRDGLGPGRGARPLPGAQARRRTCERQPAGRRAGGWACPPPCTWPWAPTSSTCTRPAIRRAVGRATHLDFRILAGQVARLGGGGVYLNVGSAVLLPEVFLKAVTLARNLGHELTRLRHRQPRLHPVLPPEHQRGAAAHARRGPRLQPHRPPRDPGAAAGRGPDPRQSRPLGASSTVSARRRPATVSPSRRRRRPARARAFPASRPRECGPRAEGPPSQSISSARPPMVSQPERRNFSTRARAPPRSLPAIWLQPSGRRAQGAARSASSISSAPAYQHARRQRSNTRPVCGRGPLLSRRTRAEGPRWALPDRVAGDVTVASRPQRRNVFPSRTSFQPAMSGP